MKFLKADEIINNKISFIEDCDLVTFGILNSSVFNCWNKAVSGRTRNDTVISNKITYNNFPFVEPSDQDATRISVKSQVILQAREIYPSSSLADLYDQSSMPHEVLKAHRELDAVILKLYSLQVNASETQILSTLFQLYAELSGDTLL
jgi:hypothetical protein